MNEIKRINRAGNLIHTTDISNLETVIKYGLISLSHENDWQTINPKLRRCPCGQDLGTGLVRYLGKSATLYFHSLGHHTPTSPNPEELGLENLYWPINEGTFGIFIEPENLLSLPTLSLGERLLASIGERTYSRRLAEENYWHRVYQLAKKFGERRIFDREFKISCCVPWEKFSGLIIDQKNEEEALRLMNAFRAEMKKPLYDSKGNVLYRL